ncbi:MAG: WD40/YVTN/BNR-like repeat-containing protein [Fimbriimonadaceae bacterium]
MSLAVAAGLPAVRKPGCIYVRIGAAGRARAIARARRFGSLVPTDAKTGEFTLTLKAGMSESRALVALRADRGISFVWSDSKPISKRAQLQSVDAVTAMFNAVKPSRKEALADLAKGRRRGHDENGADYLGGYLYFLSRRAYPYDRMDWSAYGPAVKHATAMPTFGVSSRAPGAHATGTGGKKWTFLGPKNMTFPYEWGFGLGPGSGRVNAAAYDPTTPGTYYAGGAEGGVWKTTDSGATWAPLGDAWPYICVSSIAVDPGNPKVVYAGTGDFPGWYSFSVGVMKTTDGGVTWSNLGRAQFGGSCVSTVVVDPDNTSIVTVATGDGPYQVELPGNVWQSTDGGATWAPAIATNAEWSDLSISLKDGASRHYYATGSSGGTNYLERSDNQGVSWTALTPPTGISGGSCQIKASAVDAKTVYFMAPTSHKIFKSTDSGGTWTDITGNLSTLGDWGQSTYDYYVTVVNNGGVDDLFVGLIDVYELATSGGTWTSVIHAYSGNDLTHVDQHCLTVNPKNPNDILVGNDGGIYHGTRANGTWSFTSLNKTMGVTQFYDGVWSATNPSLMIGGAQDNGTPLSTGDLANWGVVIGGDGFFAAMNPANSKIQYGTVYYDSVVETQDGWNSSFGMSPPVGKGEPTPFVTIIQQDPVNTQYLYCTSNYLYQWNNNTLSWASHLGGAQLTNGAVIHCVSVAPSNGSTIYTGSDDGRIYVSRNGGVSFTNINSGSLPNRAISSISVDRKNPNSIVVGVSGTGTAHLYQCANTLAATPSYTSVSGSGAGALPDISLNCMDRDLANQATTWYVGTDVGVFVTTNAGRTWQNATTPLGLPDVQVTAIQATRYQTINVATYGRGMWKLSVAAIGGNAQAPSAVKAIDGAFTTGAPLPLNGFIQQLASDDGIYVGMASAHNAAAQAQAATMEADFSLGAGHTLSGVGFSITTSSTAQVTMQVFLFNYVTNRFDLVNTYPSSASLSNTITTVSVPNPAVYMNAAGLVRADFRALSPDRNGSPFSMQYDSFTISPSLN